MDPAGRPDLHHSRSPFAIFSLFLSLSLAPGPGLPVWPPPHRRSLRGRSLPRPPASLAGPSPSGAAVPLRRCGSGKLLHKGTLS